MATIKDIARISGYSIGTVSRVLNHRPDVSEEAKKKIQKVIEEEGFQPNTNAKHLKQQSSSSIMVLISGYGNMFFSELLEQIQKELALNGEDASVVFLDENSDSVAEAVRMCLERRPKGIIFLGGTLDDFKNGFEKVNVPCVLLTNYAKDLGFPLLSSFSTDDREASKQAIRLLAQAGHRKIGVIGGFLEHASIIENRLSGCEEEFRHWNIPFDRKTHYEECRFSMEGGYTAAAELLERCPDITAVFAMGDTIAIGAMRAIKDLGKQIPEDLSVIGYDGIAASLYTSPRLTTVRLDTAQIAERGVQDLLMRINYTKPAVHELVPYQNIYGGSVKNPRIKEVKGHGNSRPEAH